jgi:hypothetical protein
LSRAKTYVVASILAGGVCSLVSGGALAAPHSQTARKGASDAAIRERYRAGETKLEALDYAGALIEFQAADALKPAPQAARYIGLCQDKLGLYQEAIVAYERFLASVPPKLAREGDEVRRRVEEIKKMPGKIHVETTPAGATVVVDGYAEAQATPVDVSISPGRHSLHVSKDGQESQDREVEVALGSHTDINLQLVPIGGPVVAGLPPPPLVSSPSLPSPPPLPPEPHSKAQAFIVGGLSVASLAVGTAFGVLALNDRNNFNRNPTAAGADTAEFHELICDVAFGAALTLGVTSAVLFLKKDGMPARKGVGRATSATAPWTYPPSAITVTPFMDGHHVGAGARVWF